MMLNQIPPFPQIPLDVLAADWLNDTPIDTRTRVYLVETCLGHVILALEKLLREADRRGALPTAEEAASGATESQSWPEGFNAINFLAQQLMRSNPRFSQLSDGSPYAESMRVVERELRDRVYASAGDRAAARQAELERRQQKFAEVHAGRVAETRQRLEPYLRQLPRSARSRGHVYSVLLRLDQQHVKSDPVGARLFPQLREAHVTREGAFDDDEELLTALTPHLEPLSEDELMRVGKALAQVDDNVAVDTEGASALAASDVLGEAAGEDELTEETTGEEKHGPAEVEATSTEEGPAVHVDQQTDEDAASASAETIAGAAGDEAADDEPAPAGDDGTAVIQETSQGEEELDGEAAGDAEVGSEEDAGPDETVEGTTQAEQADQQPAAQAEEDTAVMESNESSTMVPSDPPAPEDGQDGQEQNDGAEESSQKE
jgi:hypothetical protein